jgi:hypothetical protein
MISLLFKILGVSPKGSSWNKAFWARFAGLRKGGLPNCGFRIADFWSLTPNSAFRILQFGSFIQALKKHPLSQILKRTPLLVESPRGFTQSGIP